MRTGRSGKAHQAASTRSLRGSWRRRAGTAPPLPRHGRRTAVRPVCRRELPQGAGVARLATTVQIRPVEPRRSKATASRQASSITGRGYCALFSRIGIVGAIRPCSSSDRAWQTSSRKGNGVRIPCPQLALATSGRVASPQWRSQCRRPWPSGAPGAMITVIVDPIGLGRFRAVLGERLLCESRTPLLGAARVLLAD
jgi:hypothetical protein